MKNLRNIKGVSALSRAEQQSVAGGIGGDPDLSLCGCDCAGRVTGPIYCNWYIACPQVYTCNETS
jgi:hypothetical protein